MLKKATGHIIPLEVIAKGLKMVLNVIGRRATNRTKRSLTAIMVRTALVEKYESLVHYYWLTDTFFLPILETNGGFSTSGP